MIADTLFWAHHGGGFGRLYRNRREIRHDYRERAGVGGLLGFILDSKEFDFFLSLLIILICVNLYQNFLQHPFTSISVWLMVLLHYQKSLGYELVTADTFHKYTYHPNQILRNGQWYRLFTAPFLHKGRKLLFFLSMSALSALSEEERRATVNVDLSSYSFLSAQEQRQFSQHPAPLGYRAAFLLALVGATGLIYIAVCNKYKERGAMHTFTCGFTGVLFALKSYLNSARGGAGITAMSFPLLGEFFSLSLPIPVPSFAAHFVELCLVTLIFQEESNWHLNAAGIIAGYLFYAVTMLYNLASQHDFSFSDTSAYTNEWLMRRLMGVLVLVITYLVYKVMDVTDRLERQFQTNREEKQTSHGAKENQTPHGEEKKDEQPYRRHVTSDIYDDEDNESMPSSNQDFVSSSLYDDASEVGTGDEVSEGKSTLSEDGESQSENNNRFRGDDDDDCSMLTDPDKSAQLALFPDDVAKALDRLTAESAREDAERVAYALTTILQMIRNATTVGQQESKYRRIPLNNKRVKNCNVEGAKELVLALGFEVKEDFDDRKCFVYPRQGIPDWMPSAIDAMERALAGHQKPGPPYDAGSVRAARLKKLEQKKSPRKPREGQFTAGMGGGNSKALYYHGGT